MTLPEPRPWPHGIRGEAVRITVVTADDTPIPRGVIRFLAPTEFSYRYRFNPDDAPGTYEAVEVRARVEDPSSFEAFPSAVLFEMWSRYVVRGCDEADDDTGSVRCFVDNATIEEEAGAFTLYGDVLPPNTIVISSQSPVSAP